MVSADWWVVGQRRCRPPTSRACLPRGEAERLVRDGDRGPSVGGEVEHGTDRVDALGHHDRLLMDRLEEVHVLPHQTHPRLPEDVLHHVAEPEPAAPTELHDLRSTVHAFPWGKEQETRRTPERFQDLPRVRGRLPETDMVDVDVHQGG